MVEMVVAIVQVLQMAQILLEILIFQKIYKELV